MSDFPSDSAHAKRLLTRRSLLGGGLSLLGTAALGSLLGQGAARAMPHFTPRVRRVVYLFMAGGPSQLESFDHKPGLEAGDTLPDSVRGDQRLTSFAPEQLKIQPSRFSFDRYGSGDGTWVSELFPHTAGIVDDLCVIRSMRTDAINHDPAMTLMQSGSQLSGRPPMGAWASYGLGSLNESLPTFTVLLSMSRDLTRNPQPLLNSLWGSGFLPGRHQGVRFHPGAEPVLYLEDGAGVSDASRTRLRDARNALDAMHFERTGDPAIATRIEAFELAHRMQTAVPSVTDLSDEPASTWARYGEDARVPGTFAANCVLARRLLENDVRFVQLYHSDWDHHETMVTDHPKAARDTDRAAAALVSDLKERGLLDDTLVIWGGEFGRTVYVQNPRGSNYGRDHHPRCFSMWLAGGGVRGGIVHGQTDEFSYNVVEDEVHVHDLHATVLHLLGFDHERLTYRYSGRDFRLTDVAGNVVHDILS